jgi:hypothetical protein
VKTNAHPLGEVPAGRLDRFALCAGDAATLNPDLRERRRANDPNGKHARHQGGAMTKNVITVFYAAVLLAASLMLGAMAVVEYRGFLLPSPLLVWLMASLAAFMVCDQLLQFCIRRGFIG